jgi:hypothetical protein
MSSVRYLTGVTILAVAAAGIVWLASPIIRIQLACGVGLGFLIQAPLGWLTLRTIGTGRFQLVWMLGMLIRLMAVALAGLVLAPALGWQMVPLVGSLLVTILALLTVEVLTVAQSNSGIKAR